MKRWHVALFAGVAVLLAAFVYVRSYLRENEVWYAVPQPVVQDVTRSAVDYYVDKISQESVDYVIYLIVDPSVDWGKLLAGLPQRGNITYRRGSSTMGLDALDRDQRPQEGKVARILSITVVNGSPTQVNVRLAWIASNVGQHFRAYALARKSGKWTVVKDEVIGVI